MVDAEFTNLDPLRPRDALFGDLTNSTRLYHDIDPRSQDEIKYIDVCSLYPFICEYGLLPLRHPTILSQENIDKYSAIQWADQMQSVTTNRFVPSRVTIRQMAS